MKKGIFITLICTAFASAGFAETKIINKAERKVIELDEMAKSALKSWNSGFVLYDIDEYAGAVIDMFKDDAGMLPMATFGDFNGDGKKDLALLGHDTKTEFGVILLNQKNKYDVLVMEEDDFRAPEKQSIMGPGGRQVGVGTYLQHVANNELELKKKPSDKLEAVQVEAFGGSTSQYYVIDGKVIRSKGEE